MKNVFVSFWKLLQNVTVYSNYKILFVKKSEKSIANLAMADIIK